LYRNRGTSVLFEGTSPQILSATDGKNLQLWK